jgi:hypothetical protein
MKRIFKIQKRGYKELDHIELDKYKIFIITKEVFCGA